jgi:hypothetical protein
MSILKPIRLLGTTAVMVTFPLLSAIAQTQSPMSPSTGTPPTVVRPEMGLPPGQGQVQSARPMDRSTTADTKVNPLIGALVYSSDGAKLGSVRSVETGTDGTTTAIHFRTGGFLGFGGKIVAIPASKFTASGARIDIHMSAVDVSQLPAVEDEN